MCIFKSSLGWGTWVAQLAKHLTGFLQRSWSQSPENEPTKGSALGKESVCFSASLSLCPSHNSHMHVCALSNEYVNLKKRKRKKKALLIILWCTEGLDTSDLWHLDHSEALSEAIQIIKCLIFNPKEAYRELFLSLVMIIITKSYFLWFLNVFILNKEQYTLLVLTRWH